MDNNNKNNEEILDSIMRDQQTREQKYDIKTGYLLKSNDKKPEAFKQAEIQNDDDKETNLFIHAPVQSADRGEPMFIINDKKSSRFKGSTSGGKSMARVKKPVSKKTVGFILLGVILFLCALAGTVVAIIFNEPHKVNISCGYFEGINILDSGKKEVTEIKLKRNQSFLFKIELVKGYEKDSNITVTFNNDIIKPDKDGYYLIKCVGDELNLHISGVRKNRT